MHEIAPQGIGEGILINLIKNAIQWVQSAPIPPRAPVFNLLHSFVLNRIAGERCEYCECCLGEPPLASNAERDLPP